MLRKAGQAIGTMVAGAAIDQMSKSGEQPAPRPPRVLSRGDTVLGGLTQRTKLPEDAPGPVEKGVMGQVDNRVRVGEKMVNILQHPERAMERAAEMKANIESDIELARGVVAIAQGEPLTVSDGARLAGAAARSAESTLMSAARGGFAAATTSKESVEKLGESVAERAQYEAMSVGSGFAASQAIGAGLTMLPHPGFKLAGAAVRATGQLAAGSNASEAMRKMGEHVDGPVRQEIAAIAREKAAKE